MNQAHVRLQLPTTPDAPSLLAFAALLVFARTRELPHPALALVRAAGEPGTCAHADFAECQTLQQALQAVHTAPEAPAQSQVQAFTIRPQLEQAPQPDTLTWLALPDGGTALALQAGTVIGSALLAQDFLEKIALVLEQLRAGTPLADVSLLTDTSRAIVADPSRPIVARRFEPTPSVFLRVAKQHATQPAISDGACSYDYRSLADATQYLAQCLLDAGLRPGETVMVSGPSSFGTIAGFMAVLLAGGVLVSLDPTLPADRQKQIIDISEARFAIFSSATPGAPVPALTPHTLRIDAWPDAAALRTLVPAGPVAVELDDDASAYVFFTSGSTGAPKGVLGRHQGLAHFLDWQRSNFPLGPGDRSAQITALSFDVVLRDILFPLTSGACIHVPERAAVFDARRILAWMAQQRITILHSVPSLMKAWLQSDTSARPFQTLKYIFFAGEPLSDDLLRRFQAAASEGVTITNLYGPTETTLAKLSNRLQAIEPGIQPIGKPQPGVDVLILRERRLLCGLDEIGEIVIRTPYRSKGYFKAPELTAEVFIPNPWGSAPDDLVYCTGDLGKYREDGSIQIYGRIDAQIKIRGVRIEPNEIEAHILKFPGVANAAVTTRMGDNQEKTLYAFVALADTGKAADMLEFNRAVREFLKERLPEVMIPKRLIALEEIPHLPNGKVNRKALAALEITEEAQGPAADLGDLGETGRALVAGFEKALGYRLRDADASFLDHGGDSLSYIQASLTVEKELGWLPDNWDRMGVRELVKQRKATRDRSLSIHSTIVARAVAIVLIVLDHFGVLGREIGMTSALFVVAGWSFGRYQVNAIYRSGSTRSVWSLIGKIALPTALFVLAQQVAMHQYRLQSLLFLDNFVDPYFDLQVHFSYYWFINVLLQIMVIAALPLAFKPVRDYAFHHQFAYGLAGTAAALVLGQLVILAWDHWLAGTVEPTSTYVIGQLPHIRLWLFFLGIAIAAAVTAPQKVLLAVVVVVMLVVTRFVAKTPLTISIASVPIVLLIIARDKVRLPARLVPLVNHIAGASLFIYLGHMVVYLHLMDWVKATHPLMMSAATIVASILLWQAWEALQPHLHRMLTAPLRALGLRTGDGAPRATGDAL